MKIKEVYIFTNRNTVFFDEKGEQIANCQRAISWNKLESYEEYKVDVVPEAFAVPATIKDVLKRVMNDNPVIYIARWQEWRHEITIDEFCSLIGFGLWYWEEKLQKDNGGSDD